MRDDTIFALSSGPLPCAIAVIRSSGPAAIEAAARLMNTPPKPRRPALRRLHDPADGSLIDSALVVLFPGPGSATGEDVVEYQCHGSRAVAHALLQSLARMPGLREAEPGEFTRRALANGRIDLTEAEGLADLLEAETERQRRAALDSAGGAVRRQAEAWRDRILTLNARAEAAIDYAEDDAVDVIDETIVAEAADLAADMNAHLANPRMEQIRKGIRVVIAGPPNAGKSTLLNALVGADRAIVTEIAGTTRDTIEVPVAFDGLAYTLVDTAGLRETEDRVERIGIDRAKSELARSEIILWLGDSAVAPPGAMQLFAKSDQRGSIAPSGTISVSALNGAGIDALKSAISDRAAQLMPSSPPFLLNERQAGHIADAAAALARLGPSLDLAMVAEELRYARVSIDRVTGHQGVEDVLDHLFGRFCLGK